MLSQIEITVNGETHAVPAHWSVEDLVKSLEPAARGPVAVEVNEEIVRREHWAATNLQPGDRVEVVHFVGGGEYER